MGAPADRDGGIGAAIVGIPFDAGTHPTRIGSRLGPSAIRDQSALIMPFDPASGIDLVEENGLVDVGDAAVVSGQVEASFPNATSLVEDVIDRGAVPLAIGGDGLITLPVLRAVGPRHDGLAVVHIDAHTDSYPGPGFTTAHTFTRAVEEGLIDPRRSFHIGLRGTTYDPAAWHHAEELGFNLITMDQWQQMGTGELAALVLGLLGQGSAHLSFDMDVFDPSVAPGVCTPAWGGVAAADGLALIDELSARSWVGFDLQTVSPPHDVGGMTALLAGTVMARFLLGLASTGRI